MSLAVQLSLDVESGLAAVPAPEIVIENGEVFTRRWIVELILDLVGYVPERDLAALRAVEPACGKGAFLGPMVSRLSASARLHGRDITECAGALRAFDLQPAHVRAAQMLTAECLVADGWSLEAVKGVVEGWVTRADYLLAEDLGPADVVVGNPPYIRLETVPGARMRAYRRACPTMVGRADIYVGFFERAIHSLAPGGALGFICADRWMRNQYGRALRQLISDHCSMDAVITLHDVNAFEEAVAAYPAVTVLSRRSQDSSIVAETSGRFDAAQAVILSEWARSSRRAPLELAALRADRLPGWFGGADSWPSGSPRQLCMIEDLNDRFQPLQELRTGTRVGIGVATGADEAFVTRDPNLVEPSRLLPLSMVADTRTGSFSWSGNYLVDPWDHDGRLVDLAAHPLLREHLGRAAEVLRGRHVARRRPPDWYRTIDKVDHALTGRPKLLFPDMKLRIHPVLDKGGFYPHHNLYYVVSDVWDLEVLGGLLLSRIAESFVSAYGVKMRGGTLRFQAQYLRRIRVPSPEDIPADAAEALRMAFAARDVDAATDVAAALYGVDMADYRRAGSRFV